jgi:hypothetical protein
VAGPRRIFTGFPEPPGKVTKRCSPAVVNRCLRPSRPGTGIALWRRGPVRPPLSSAARLRAQEKRDYYSQAFRVAAGRGTDPARLQTGSLCPIVLVRFRLFFGTDVISTIDVGLRPGQTLVFNWGLFWGLRAGNQSSGYVPRGFLSGSPRSTEMSL